MEIYDDTYSIYDEYLDIAIPTVEYIKAITGFNLDVLGGTPSAIDTEQRVKSLTIDARNFLFRLKENEMTKNIMSYLIKYYGDWRKAFVNYAVAYIKQTFKDPDWVEVPRQIEDAIYGSLLKQQEFAGPILSEYLNYVS